MPTKNSTRAVKAARLVSLHVNGFSRRLEGTFICTFSAGMSAEVVIDTAGRGATITDCRDVAGSFTADAHDAIFAAWESDGAQSSNMLCTTVAKIERALKAQGVTVGTMDFATGKVG